MARKPTLVDRYMSEIISYGGELYKRADVIRDMRTNGATQGMIDRWFQGYELGQRLREQDKAEQAATQSASAKIAK